MPGAAAEVKELWSKACRSLEAAKLLLQAGYHDFAASRGYYAMFYAAEAALLTEGRSFSRHAAVIAAFGRHFVASGRLPQRLHRYLLDAFDLRLLGDYDAPAKVARSRAEKVLDWVEEFLGEIAEFLKSQGYQLGPAP